MADTEADQQDYEPPALVDLGTAEELTANNTGISADGGIETSSLL